MTDIQLLEASFLPLERRTPPQPCFFSIIGRDAAGRIPGFVRAYRAAAEKDGASLQGLANPKEDEIKHFYHDAGTAFALDAPLIARHGALWLGQVRATERPRLCQAIYNTLTLLRQQGANDYILKNVYTKFMCWLRGPLGRVLSRLGGPEPPKVLFEGDASRHEIFFLSLLHQAGCDVWYLNYLSAASYEKADPQCRFSRRIAGEILSAPPPPEPPPPPPPAWEKAGKDLAINQWMDCPPWEAVLRPYSQRNAGDGKRGSVFAVLLGADERKAYRNRLFALRRALDGAPRTWILVEQRFPPPTTDETKVFQAVDRRLARPQLIQVLAERLPAGNPWTLPAQRAFSLVMRQLPESNGNRFFNYGVRLACWLGRYAWRLFKKPSKDYPPALVYYGAITEPEISLLWALAQVGVDVLYASPQKGNAFAGHFLPHNWVEAAFENSLPMEPFPRREEKVLARTTAYDAAQELNQILYSDTGMFRDRQFARSQPVTLRTTYDEVAQLWPEEAQYRPSFRTEGGVVYVPNLFTKICGVDKGDLPLYWDGIRALAAAPNTELVTSLPFLEARTPAGGITRDTARLFLHDGRLDPKAIMAFPAYRYGYLPEDTQNYILEKIQALMDYDLIVDGGPDVLAVMLSVLLNLDKERLRMLQNFDFTRAIPKLLIVDVTETLFTLEECILLAFLNLVGFDIVVFTPTGYRNLETHIHPDSFNTLNVGPFQYDLAIPDLRARRPAGKPGFFDRLFGANVVKNRNE